MSKTTKFIEKLKKKWGINSTLDVVLILVVFSLAGSSILFVKRPVFHFFDLNESHVAIKTVIYLLIVFPCYQIFLLIYGAILGQFNFFWDKEKKLGRWIINLLSKKSSEK